jgi:hypothetical protein
MPLYSSETERIRVERGDAKRFSVWADPHLIHFINCVSYDTKGDDDMRFSIMPFRNGALVNEGKNGETYYEAEVRRTERGFAEFSIKSLELPEDVRVNRQLLSLTGRRRFHRGAEEFIVPQGYEGQLVVELLKYAAGGDDEFMFGVLTLGLGNTISLIAFTDFGDNNSEITLRVTFLQWPKGRKYVVNGGLITADNNTTVRFQIPQGRGNWVFTPAAYVTDSSKYARVDFERGGILEEEILQHPSLAGRDLSSLWNLFGFAKNTGEAVVAGQAGQYSAAIANGVNAVENLVTALKGIQRERRDDDFSWILRGGDFDGLPRASLETKYGNRFSYASARLVSFQFPDIESNVILI